MGTKPALRHHLLTHRSESFHKCKQCMSFTRAERLIIHTDERQRKKRNSTKRKEALWSNFPSHSSAKERLHYVASHSVKLRIWGFTLSLTLGSNHLNQNQNKISPHSQWRKALHVFFMQQIIQPIWKSEDSHYYYYLALTLEKTRTIANNVILKTATRKTLGFHLHTYTGENPYKCIQSNY